jgi:hypothetical protein
MSPPFVSDSEEAPLWALECSVSLLHERPLAEFEAALQGLQGQDWRDLYFWLRFNAGYIVGVEQYQPEETP